MTTRGSDGESQPFPPMPLFVESGPTVMEEIIGAGSLDSLVPMINIMRNLPLYAGCMADMIEFLQAKKMEEEYRDFLKGRLCEHHAEKAPPDIFDSVPEVLVLFHLKLEEYLGTLDLERCKGHEHDAEDN